MRETLFVPEPDQFILLSGAECELDSTNQVFRRLTHLAGH